MATVRVRGNMNNISIRWMRRTMIMPIQTGRIADSKRATKSTCKMIPGIFFTHSWLLETSFGKEECCKKGRMLQSHSVREC